MPMDELLDCPIWWNGKDIVEAAFCEEFTRNHQLAYDCSAFFTPEGHMTDERPLKQKIYHELKICAVKNVPHTINNIVELLKFYSTGIDLAPQQDRVHLANGTLYLDGTFVPESLRSSAAVCRSGTIPMLRDRKSGCDFCMTCSMRKISRLCRNTSDTASSPLPKVRE